MEQSDLLRLVVSKLEGLQIRYFVTGSVATIYYGEPRFTNDIDLVAALSPGDVTKLCRVFPAPEFYVSEEAAREAIASKGQFNIIHPGSGLKVDVMVPPKTPFNDLRFARSRRVRPSPDYEASFASAEDLILKKMDYYREGGSEKHLRDIAGVLKISGEELDLRYIEEWAARLNLGTIWQTVLQRRNRPDTSKG